MLREFVTAHRSEIILRTRAKVALRVSPDIVDDDLLNGVPLFLEQLVEALAKPTPTDEAIGPSAARHGANMLRMGYTIAQVVHDYGDVCQAVTELAEEIGETLTIDEFHTLNRCLDDAIAEAVSEYSRLRERKQADMETDRIGELAHEMRNRLGSAMLAYDALKHGRIGIAGSTAAIVDRSLRALRALIDTALSQVRIETGKQNWERVLVSDLLEELAIDLSLDAHKRGITIALNDPPRGVEVRIDRVVLTAVLHNVLQNALKFSKAHSVIELTALVTPDRVIFEVEDECGGLPSGTAEELFTPYFQKGDNKTGLGLGLSISRKGIESHGGHMSVRDVPGQGCVFIIDVPRYPSNVSATPFPVVKAL